MGFSRQEHWSGLPFPFPGDLPDLGIKPRSLALQADSFPPSHQSESVSCSIVPDSLRPHGLQSARVLCPWDSPGKKTGMGAYSLFQGIFPIQGSNLGLLHCRHILHSLSCQGSSYTWVVHTNQCSTFRCRQSC